MQSVRLQGGARALSIAIAVLCSLGSRAHAQSAEAEAAFGEGDRLMAAGKIAEACDAFEASNKVEPRAGTLIRLGECREKNRQLASAWSAYKDALTRVRDPRKREFALARATDLEPRLSFLTISVPDESRIDSLAILRNGKPVDPLMWNRAVPVDGGPYVITGRAPGHEAWQTTVEVPIDHGKVSVDVPKFKELAKLVAPPASAAPAAPAAPIVATEAAREASRFTTRRKVAIGLGGGAVIGLGTGAALGVVARSRQSQADALCPDPGVPCSGATRARSLNHTAHGLALGADAGFGLGAALALAAGVLWATGGPELAHGVAVAPLPGGVGLALGGSF